MRITLLNSTCCAAFAMLSIAPVHAETSISTATTTPVTTGTVNAGSADDIKITSAGSIKPSTGIAVHINSDHKLTNEGLIQFTNADGSRGVVAEDGVTSTIINSASGKIILDESYAPTDQDNDGDLDGDFATGTNRIGIETLGNFTGDITNDGQISIEGNNSYGVKLGSDLTGKFTNNGSISVLGDNAVGVELQNVTGDVRLAGTITATGENATAARLAGDVTGRLEVQGALTATGYRYTTPPADPSKLDADDLLQGGPALSIEGNVTGGILLAIPPKDTDPENADEDADGIEDAKEGSAAVRSYGSAPAMRIGHSSDNITISALQGIGTDFGVVIDGIVVGSGLYAGVDGAGLQIGGLGGDVDIEGGLGISGGVGAGSKDAAATAIHIGSGATVPEIRNSGLIEAVTGGDAATAIATAIQIDAGSDVSTLKNSGRILAKTGGDDGIARAIVDASGNVTLIENSGLISATGALATSDRNIAIDVSANTSGVTVKQTAVASGIAAPSIIGDVKFGLGDDIFDIADGRVQGNSSFGEGNNLLSLSGDGIHEGNAIFGSGNDQLNLAGTSAFIGDADFGGGDDQLNITGTSIFSGNLANATGLAASVSGGVFDVKGSANIASLAITGGGALAVTLGGDDATNLNISGNASFADDSKLILLISNIDESEGQHIIVTAGSITGADKIALDNAYLPFLYEGVFTYNATELTVDVSRKDFSDLGLNRSEMTIFNAAVDAATGDQLVEDTILSIYSQEGFRHTLGQMLPNHAGGIFESVTAGSRALSRWLIEPNAPYRDEGKWGWFVNQAVWGQSKSIGDTSSYKISGWGISLGGEIKTDLGNFGGSVAYLGGKDANRDNENEVLAHQWEGALHWRYLSGGLNAHARISGAPVSLDSTRVFDGVGSVRKTINGKWNAKLYSASGGVAYDASAGGFTIRPAVTVDYYKLSEDGYQETGGGDALDLKIADRSSDELAVSGTLAVGMMFGGRDIYDGFTRIELEGGRRQIVSGDLGATSAAFNGGDEFILSPDQRSSGWIGRVRAVAGNSAFQFGGEISAEEKQSRTALAVRATLRMGL